MMNGIKTICFYGPESTGKSFFTQRMAMLYKTTYVPEVAREMLITNDFSLDDIVAIGKAQTERVIEKLKNANRILCCDTDLITTQIYAKIYLDIVPPILVELEKKVTYDLYLLFNIDVPWVADGLRDMGHRRQEMFDCFKKELEIRKIPYVLVYGNEQEREKIVTQAINQLLK